MTSFTHPPHTILLRTQQSRDQHSCTIVYHGPEWLPSYTSKPRLSQLNHLPNTYPAMPKSLLQLSRQHTTRHVVQFACLACAGRLPTPSTASQSTCTPSSRRSFSVLNRPPPNYPGHVPLTRIEQASLAIGSGIMALVNPYRAGAFHTFFFVAAVARKASPQRLTAKF